MLYLKRRLTLWIYFDKMHSFVVLYNIVRILGMRYKNYIIYKLAHLARKAGYNFQEASDSRVFAMQSTIAKLGGGVKVSITVDGKTGEWVAESVDLEGIITGGKHFFPKEVNETIKDALFTHFDIPPHLCNDSLLRSEGEPIVVEQKVYA